MSDRPPTGSHITDAPHASFLIDADDFAASIAGSDRYAPSLDIPGWLGSKDLRQGRAALAKVVTAYADTTDDRQYYADRRFFHPEGDDRTSVNLGGARGRSSSPPWAEDAQHLTSTKP